MVRDILLMYYQRHETLLPYGHFIYAAYDCFHGWLLVSLAIFFVLVFTSRPYPSN